MIQVYVSLIETTLESNDALINKKENKDENWRERIADFGLSREFPMGIITQVSTNLAGTFG